MVGTIGHAFGEDGVELQRCQVFDEEKALNRKISVPPQTRMGDVPLYYFFNIAIYCWRAPNKF
jgi:hypothetical protein